jgi:AcrR family transcriptional regulator
MARPADPNIRIQLIAAAESVFAARGLDGARVEDITGRAGCSKGAFYQHFESKEELFLQIVETMIARLHHLLDAPVMGPRDRSDLAEVEARWLARDVEILEFVWQNRDIVRLVLEGGKSASSAHLMDAFSSRVRQVIDEFLGWGNEVGLCRRGLDVTLAATFIAGAYDQMARELVRLKEKPDLPHWARQNQAFVLGGISDSSVIHSHRRRAHS